VSHPTVEPAEEDPAICFVKAYARKPIGVPTSNLIPLKGKANKNRANAIDWSDAYFYNMMDEPNVYEDSEDEDEWSDDTESQYYSEGESSSAEDSEYEDESSEYSDSDASSNLSNDLEYEDGFDYGDELSYYGEHYNDDWGFSDGFSDGYYDEEDNAYPRRRRRGRPGARRRRRQGPRIRRPISHEPARRRRRRQQKREPEER